MDELGILDLDDDSKTENTRAAYKLEQIANALPAKRAGHPSSVFFLTADAYGILPPIARLSRDQALYWFLSGFTAKLAGTEIGVKEPQPTFSACFGAPFLPQPPSVYAELLGERLDRHGATVWLVSTGWTGGPYGEGHRMPIAATRALLHAALSGELAGVEYRTDPVFGFDVPVAVPGVQSSLLDPRLTWADPAAYDEKARELAQMFRRNFERFEGVSPASRRGRPCVSSEAGFLLLLHAGAAIRAWWRSAPLPPSSRGCSFVLAAGAATRAEKATTVGVPTASTFARSLDGQAGRFQHRSGSARCAHLARRPGHGVDGRDRGDIRLGLAARRDAGEVGGVPRDA